MRAEPKHHARISLTGYVEDGFIYATFKSQPKSLQRQVITNLLLRELSEHRFRSFASKRYLREFFGSRNRHYTDFNSLLGHLPLKALFQGQ
jgi:hypothetical protein